MSGCAENAFDRRHLLLGLLGAAGATALAPASRAEPAVTPARIVRLSRASFPAESYEEVRGRLDEAQRTLVPGLRALPGCLHYHAAIDRESATMINVSVWRSLEDAAQMQSFAPMLALAESFARIGVRFERPIVNYEVLWQL